MERKISEDADDSAGSSLVPSMLESLLLGLVVLVTTIARWSWVGLLKQAKEQYSTEHFGHLYFAWDWWQMEQMARAMMR